LSVDLGYHFLRKSLFCSETRPGEVQSLIQSCFDQFTEAKLVHTEHLTNIYCST